MAQAPKYGSTVRITYEMIASLLSLPEECRIAEVSGDLNRDLATFKIHSDTRLPGLTYEVAEGCEYPNISITDVAMLERALSIVDNLKKRAAEGDEHAIDVLNNYEDKRDSNE